MFLKATNSFFAFQKKLYLKCLDEVNHLIGKKRRYLSQYEVEFDESISEGYKEVDFDAVIEAIGFSKIVLFGDFHTLPNSQSLLIKTIKAYREFDRESPITIALECFSTHDKKSIDDYLRGDISEREFLKETGYHTGWGFPWGHYRRIFSYAKEIGATILPINNPLYKVNVRDQKISETLVKEIKRSNDTCKIFCLIGEFHLAERHLPVELKHRMPSLSLKKNIVKILVNVDSYFFNHTITSAPHKETVLSLANSYFCILDTPPWIKWLTYRLWQDQDNHDNLEIHEPQFLSANEYCLLDLENDDLEYKIVQHAQSLAKLFSVHIQLDSFYSYKFVKYNENELSNYNLNSFEKSLLQNSIEDLDSYVCEKNKVVFYQRLTLKVLTSCAGQILFILKTGGKIKTFDHGSFVCREILKGFFSSVVQVIYNPYVYSGKNVHKNNIEDLDQKIRFIIENKNLGKNESLTQIISYIQEKMKDDLRSYSKFNERVARSIFSLIIKEKSGKISLIKNNFLREDSGFSFEEGLMNIMRLSLLK